MQETQVAPDVLSSLLRTILDDVRYEETVRVLEVIGTQLGNSKSGELDSERMRIALECFLQESVREVISIPLCSNLFEQESLRGTKLFEATVSECIRPYTDTFDPLRTLLWNQLLKQFRINIVRDIEPKTLRMVHICLSGFLYAWCILEMVQAFDEADRLKLIVSELPSGIPIARTNDGKVYVVTY